MSIPRLDGRCHRCLMGFRIPNPTIFNNPKKGKQSIVYYYRSQLFKPSPVLCEDCFQLHHKSPKALSSGVQ